MLERFTNIRKKFYKKPEEQFEDLCKTFGLYSKDGKLLEELKGRFINSNTIQFLSHFNVDGNTYLKSIDNFIFKFVPNSAKFENIILDPSSKKPIGYKALVVTVEHVDIEERKVIEKNIITSIQIGCGNNFTQNNITNINIEVIIEEIRKIDNSELSPLCDELRKVQNGEKEIKRGMFSKFAPFISDSLSNMLGSFLAGLLLRL